jgi:predicted RNA binding protein YcfA (HicA-like mRNA interferase family)
VQDILEKSGRRDSNPRPSAWQSPRDAAAPGRHAAPSGPLLERCGWKLDRVKGSHQVFRHPDHAHRVVVPMHSRDLAKGTLNQIVSASGLDRTEFLKLL